MANAGGRGSGGLPFIIAKLPSKRECTSVVLRKKRRWALMAFFWVGGSGGVPRAKPAI